jgi:hypothetical protein
MEIGEGGSYEPSRGHHAIGWFCGLFVIEIACVVTLIIYCIK